MKVGENRLVFVVVGGRNTPTLHSMMNDHDSRLHRRGFTKLLAAGLASGLATGSATRARAAAGPASDAFTSLRDRPLSIGILIFPEMDQIDFTGPFEVLARVPDAVVHVIGTERGPIRDHAGLILTPTTTVADAPALDLLQIPGGPGQQAVMTDAAVLGLIRAHMAAGKPLFSVCTGALICGAAGVLKDRRVTTHWAAFELLPYFGAIPVDQRVVIDHNLVSAAGVTAGIDGALQVAALLRGDDIAQRIQLDIQYAPEPPFHAGLPTTAPRNVVAEVRARYQPLTVARRATARAIAAQLGITRTP